MGPQPSVLHVSVFGNLLASRHTPTTGEDADPRRALSIARYLHRCADTFEQT
jgi:hypothetical protein